MRVIAGALGGRPLVAPKGHATRPTSDRVREALFSVLGDVSATSVLDLYAGTGALGIEALSRGASHAVFVENARPALEALRKNIASLGLASSAVVVATPVARAIRGLSGYNPFDLVFVDPPYVDLAEAAEAIEQLVDLGRCSERACVVLEHAARDAAPELKGLLREDTRRYGDTSLTFYVVQSPPITKADRGNEQIDEEAREDVSSAPADG